MNEDEQANTVLVKVKPESDALVESFYKGALQLRESAATTTVSNVEDIKAATDTLILIQKLKRTMKDKREEYVGPLQGYIKAINDTFKRLMDPIEEADRLLRERVLSYQKAEQEKREEQERINKLRLEAAEAERALNGGVSEPVELIVPDSPVPERVATDTGEVGTRSIRKWEVFDFGTIPDEYKVIDNGRVTKAVKAGIGAIPGIRIYEDKIITVESMKGA